MRTIPHLLAHRDPLNPFLAPAEATEASVPSPSKQETEGMTVALDTVGAILEPGSNAAEPGALEKGRSMLWVMTAAVMIQQQ